MCVCVNACVSVCVLVCVHMCEGECVCVCVADLHLAPDSLGFRRRLSRLALFVSFVPFGWPTAMVRHRVLSMHLLYGSFDQFSWALCRGEASPSGSSQMFTLAGSRLLFTGSDPGSFAVLCLRTPLFLPMIDLSQFWLRL